MNQVKRKRRKKKSAGQVFVTGFLKSFAIILALLATSYAGYAATNYYYDKFGGPKDDKAAELIKELYGEVEVVDVSKNLIYCVDGDNQIKAMVLEIFNTNTSNMDYITIPLKSQFTISNELYQKLCASGADAPQIIKLAKMDDYFSDETLYEYGVILLEDLLDIDINYYTAVGRDVFKQMFKQKTAPPVYNDEGTVISSDVQWDLRQSYIKEISALKDEGELEEYIKGKLKKCKSNLNTRSKLEYADKYQKVNPKLIYTHSIYGIMENKSFEIDIERTNALFNQILTNSSYTMEQRNTNTGAQPVQRVSQGAAIQILNGSGITGLAAKYQTSLQNDGYTVAGIGNYTSQSEKTTRILVKEEGKGTDLLEYFEGASIETAQLPEGVDIEIILGSDAAMP